MAWTPASFRAAKPEFGSATQIPDAVVQQALTDAADRCDPRVFPDTDLDAAVGLYAAHLLCLGPYGRSQRMEELKSGTRLDPGVTVYLLQWRRLARAYAGGPWAAGQTP